MKGEHSLKKEVMDRPPNSRTSAQTGLRNEARGEGERQRTEPN